MKILYLHGLKSEPENAKTCYLRHKGFDVYSPRINYDNPQIYFDLFDDIRNYNPDLIIGSSLGGYLAYHYARQLDIKAVLFNPAFVTQTQTPYLQLPIVKNQFTPYLEVHVGIKDEVVHYTDVDDYLKSNYPLYHYASIKQNMEHQVNMNIFKTIVNNSFLFKNREKITTKDHKDVSYGDIIFIVTNDYNIIKYVIKNIDDFKDSSKYLGIFYYIQNAKKYRDLKEIKFSKQDLENIVTEFKKETESSPINQLFNDYNDKIDKKEALKILNNIVKNKKQER